MSEKDRNKYFNGKLLKEKDFKNEQEYLSSKGSGEANVNEDTFYDIHLHAFNLSHPYLRAFLDRFNIGKIIDNKLRSMLNPLIGFVAAIAIFLASIVAFFIPKLKSKLSKMVNKKLNQLNNLVSVMENDIGSFFLLIENCLREHGKLTNEGLEIGGKRYSTIVLTPLMMDFGYKNIRDNEEIHYNRPSRKPIVEQVIDVFNAIKTYRSFQYSDEFEDQFPSLKPDENGGATIRVFEIYPFLAINTKNYELEDIERMLNKYFSKYKGSREDLFNNMGNFDGNIEHLGNNSFAGVKVYPPLGFDPWPEGNKQELDKVKLLYDYCQKKHIPITAHGSESGFVTVKDKGELKKITSIAKWDRVLSDYPQLKLNLAHFPINERAYKVLAKKDRLEQIVDLIGKYANFYVDFSCRAMDEAYYKKLIEYISSKPEKLQDKLRTRILFGTDFPINLTSIDSYDKYVGLFSGSQSIGHLRELFCSTNPEAFLFTKH
jgi:predicted TIM-barrel fold metal-dependent hydrolase